MDLLTQKLHRVNKNYLALAVFAALIAVFYGNTLQNGFILDDRLTIEQNPYVHSLRHLPKVVTGCVWEGASGTCEGAEHYRPVLSLSYLLTWTITPNPAFFHLVNLAYFLLVVFLLFVLVKTLIKNFAISFLTALVFLIHPVNSEVVNWVSAASELTFAVFALLTLLWYLRFRSTNRDKHFWFALLFFFLALLSKEVALVLPLVMVAIDALFFQTGIRQFLAWQTIKRYLFLAVPVFLYLVMRFAAIGAKAFTGGKEQFGGYELGERVFAFFTAFAGYIGKLVYPYPLVFLRQFEVKSDLLAPEFAGSLALFVLFAAAVYFFAKKKQNLLAFSLVWIFIFLAPVLVLFWAAGGNFYAERFLFVPGIGFSLIASSMLAYLWEKPSLVKPKKHARAAKQKSPLRFRDALRQVFIRGGEIVLAPLQPQKTRRIAVVSLVGLMLAVSWAVVFPRNAVWGDELPLFRATLSLDPDASHIRESLAATLRQRGDKEAAKLEYEEIAARDPGYRGITHIYNHLAEYYGEKEDPEKAEEYYKKSIEAAPDTNYKSYNNLGALYVEQGKYLQALTNFCKALQIDPQAPEPQSNYNRIVSSILGVEDAQYLFLYLDVMQGGAFQKSDEQKVAFKSKSCAYGTCFYTFTPHLEQGEILFPFLILATVFPNEGIRVASADFIPAASQITVAISGQYQDRLLTFTFPVCSGILYETQVSPVRG